MVLRAQGMQMLMRAYQGHMKGEFSPVPQNKMGFSGTDLFKKKKHLNYHHNLLVLLETSLSPFCASGNHILPAIKEGKLIQCRVPHSITTPLSSNPSASILNEGHSFPRTFWVHRRQINMIVLYSFLKLFTKQS